MKLQGLKEGVFLKRLNRFVGEVELKGEKVKVHIANSGRAGQILQPGSQCYIKMVPGRQKRMTHYDLTLTSVGGMTASPDTRIANALVKEALENSAIAQFAEYEEFRPEYSWSGGGHKARFDFYLSGADGECLVEVKSVTLAEGRKGMFPDAPTERGRKHLHALVAAKKQGFRAIVIFVALRDDVISVSPCDSIDPLFGEQLRKALTQGVEVMAFSSLLSPEEIVLTGEIPFLP